MSTEEPTKNVPVRWDEEMAKHAQAAAQSERPALASISMRGGVMSYEKVPVPGNKLNVIIVAFTMERRFYKERFNPDKPASPVCFSFHNGDDQVPWMPHEESHELQSEKGCAYCPMNEWGSDLNGRKGKACKEVRKLALMPGPDAKEMALLSIPVMSVRNWSNYVNGIAASAQRPPWGVITEISVHPDPRNQFIVKFDLVDLVDENRLGAIYDKIKFAEEVLRTPYDYSEPGESNADNKATKKPRKF
jgi:hypothetical protein